MHTYIYACACIYACYTHAYIYTQVQVRYSQVQVHALLSHSEASTYMNIHIREDPCICNHIHT